MKKGETYHGFTVRDVVRLEDCNSNGIWLKHERTGLEVFHLFNDDEENLFAFTFRTPPVDSTGAAHVLEHSVLCGSEKYPLKDPFIKLLNQSVKTYLNAWTSPDKTVFPGSSMVKTDYFNLMSVYGDAVFFPRLLPEIFMQEAHRLEVDEKGEVSMQGVVYNEMKGAYSSFDSVASDAVDHAALAGTPYVFDSGGNPLVIPSLTLSKLKAFHKKYYCPANCLLFLYGNIPTEEQLDFVAENFLSRMKAGGVRARIPIRISKDTIKPYHHEYGPADESEKDAKSGDKNTVLLTWRTSQFDKSGIPSFSNMVEEIFLDDLLFGDDCSPISKALITSGLGEDIAPQNGLSVDRRETIFSIGMRGVAKKNIKKLQTYIISTLQDLVKKGVSEDDFKSTCLSFEFDTREIKRIQGPYSLTYLRRCIRAWAYGDKPWTNLSMRSEFESIKKKCSEDPAYISHLIEKTFLANKERSLVVVTPSASWSRKRTTEEQKIVQSLLQKTTLKTVTKEMEKLHTFQQKIETEKEERCIPHLKRSDLTVLPKKIMTKKTEIGGITLFTNTEYTNGIMYVDIAFPADVISPVEYPYIPLLANVVTGMGWGGKTWEQTLQLIGKTVGGFTAYTRNTFVEAKRIHERYEGRDWVVFAFKTLEEQMKDALDVVSDCITQTSFKDTKRLKNLLTEYRNDEVSSVVPMGHQYASTRAMRKTERTAAIAEIWEGISSIFTVDTAIKMSPVKVGERLERIFVELKKGGAVIHITGSANGIATMKKQLPLFIKKTGLKPLAKKRIVSDKAFFALTELACGKKGQVPDDGVKADEVFIIPGTVGYASGVLHSISYDKRRGVEDAIYTRYLEKTILWEQIRTVGGAYGVMFFPDGWSPYSYYMTYRDPRPFHSLGVIQKCIQDGKKTVFTKEMVEKTVVGWYSDEIQPRTPLVRGGIGFTRKLSAISNGQQLKRIRWLISMTEKELRDSAARFAKTGGDQYTVVLCGRALIHSKSNQTTGKIIELPV